MFVSNGSVRQLLIRRFTCNTRPITSWKELWDRFFEVGNFSVLYPIEYLPFVAAFVSTIVGVSSFKVFGIIFLVYVAILSCLGLAFIGAVLVTLLWSLIAYQIANNVLNDVWHVGLQGRILVSTLAVLLVGRWSLRRFDVFGIASETSFVRPASRDDFRNANLWSGQHIHEQAKVEYKAKIEPVELKDLSPYEVLGVPINASSVEIKRAYRTLIAQYHPDKVAHLGEELRELAAQKSLELTRAFEVFNKG